MRSDYIYRELYARLKAVLLSESRGRLVYFSLGFRWTSQVVFACARWSQSYRLYFGPPGRFIYGPDVYARFNYH